MLTSGGESGQAHNDDGDRNGDDGKEDRSSWSCHNLTLAGPARITGGQTQDDIVSRMEKIIRQHSRDLNACHA